MDVMMVDALFDSFSWEDIFLHWKRSSENGLSIVNNYPAVCKVNVNYNGNGRIYSHFWLENAQFYSLVNEFSSMFEMPVFQQNKAFSDERVMRSAELMIQSKSEKERAAIWLFVFCNSLEEAYLPYPNSLLIDYVGAKARNYLQETFQEWQFRYHHRFPKLFVDENILRNVVFENYKSVVDFAIFNAFMICKNYTIALFDSELENENAPDSYRDLRKNRENRYADT